MVWRCLRSDPCQVVRVAVSDGSHGDTGHFVRVFLLSQRDDLCHSIAPGVQGYAALLATGMPCADSSTICARRQVTTDPVPLRMIRSSSSCPSPIIDLAYARTRSATKTTRP